MKHKCLTCFKEFRVEQVHYRCNNRQCDEIDEKLSAHMNKTTQIRGRVIEPESKKGWPKGTSQQRCPNPQCQKETYIRLCPNCHDQLPTALDGVQSLTVSVLGPRGSGKSLYLISTIEHLEKHVFPKCLGTSFEKSTQHTKEKYQTMRDRVYQSGRLLRPNDHAELDPEILIPFVFHTRVKSYRSGFYPIQRKNRINIVTFDVAGEACQKADLLQTNCPNLPKHEALIIIIDPTYFLKDQLPNEAKTSMVKDAEDPIVVITNIQQYIKSANNLGDKKITIPTAFVITKLDALKQMHGFSNYNSILETDKHKNGYNATYCKEVSSQLKTFLEGLGASNVVKMAHDHFGNYLFFGVTSLGMPPTEINGQIRADNLSPRNTESPWLWILHQKKLLLEVNGI